MKRFSDLIADCLPSIKEIQPWDLADRLCAEGDPPLLLDIREPYEFDMVRIPGAINVPRGILETACEYDYEETLPELVEARDREIVVICRSGKRSILAAYVMQLMGYKNVTSLQTGMRGWNDFEQAVIGKQGEPIDTDTAETYLTPNLRPEQKQPQSEKQ